VSFTDDAGGGQPQGQGAGGEGGGGAPYQEFLDRISDEEARSVAEEGFKSFDANVARKFAEHATYRKGWQPYEEMGLRDQDPQMVAWAMQLAQAAQSDPQSFYEWVNGDYASQYGLAAGAQEGEYFDPSEQLATRIDQLEQMLSTVDSRFDQQAEAQAQQEALRMIEGQIAALEKEHGDQFDRKALEMVLPHFTEAAQSREELESVVPRAWEALQGLLNKREQQTFAGKLNVPQAGEPAGPADGSAPALTTLKEAHARAMEIARAQR
jgi:hypothetical protein